MLPTALTSFLVSFLTLFSSQTPEEKPKATLSFELRHQHIVSPAAHVYFSDVPRHAPAVLPNEEDIHGTNDGAGLYNSGISTRRIRSYKPSSFDALTSARLRSMRFGQSTALSWDEDNDILAPDHENRETLLLLAKMANDAYVQPNDPAWYDLGGTWNNGSHPFGWEDDADGFRGHVFATPDNSTVVLTIKGTSAGMFGGGGPTVKKDKVNDNLLFSCCCARVDWTWSTVCGCYGGGWKCDQNCLEQALIEDSLFYNIGTNLYNNLTYMYPTSNIWIVGHSLGGALSSLLGATFGVPVIAFEAPGEKMASRRLHLPSPPSTENIIHIYHTADPIAMGTCNGILSSCALGGYAMESRCHLGKTILYDTVSELSWAVDIRTHGIVVIIDQLLNEPWKSSEEAGRQVPEAKSEDDCVECYSWEFGDFMNATV